jgi:N-formylglutamate amidohydrolase
VVLSVPHAGRAYPPELLQSARISLPRLEALEDRLVDRLVARAIAGGISAIVADAPRAQIDLNRDERELDPALIAPRPHPSSILDSARTRGGLGLIPARMSGAGDIWRERVRAEDVAWRIETIYRPYHAALARALERARARFGVAILLDCHSMPPRSGEPGQAQIVLGDRHGTSARGNFVAAAEEAVRASGFSVARNAPYAGGHITACHGRPAQGTHAIQLEVDRSTYLAADLRSPGPGFDRVAALLESVAQSLARAAEAPVAIAAE